MNEADEKEQKTKKPRKDDESDDMDIGGENKKRDIEREKVDNPAGKKRMTVKQALDKWDINQLAEYIEGEDEDNIDEEGDLERDGDELDPDEVMKARMEEIDELERRVYELADVDECWRLTGKAPI